MHTKFERLLSKSLTTLEVMTYYLVVHTGPDGLGMSSACRIITFLDSCCMVNMSMAKGTRVDLRSATRIASKPICTGARSSQRNSRNMPETDHTGEPCSSRPLPDLKKRGVRVSLQLETLDIVQHQQ